ncbi:hypothetical protein, partial [Evansella halocellulosilytica]|uniref:hypothetical protein n=1 Tax=Evansella halocellulosilytica TaxID=2011013 RepID=UPI001C534E13
FLLFQLFILYFGLIVSKNTRLHSRAQVRHLLVLHFVCIRSVFFAAGKASANRGKIAPMDLQLLLFPQASRDFDNQLG